MKKYERIIKRLYHIDKLDYEAFEKSLTLNPASDEYKELERIQEDYEAEARELLSQLKNCIGWYYQRAKTVEDFEFALKLEAEHDKLYEHMVYDLSDEEIDRQAREFVDNLLAAEIEQEQDGQSESDIPAGGARMENIFSDFELDYLIGTVTSNRENSAALAEIPDQRWKEAHKAEVVKMDKLLEKLETLKFQAVVV